MSQQNNAFADLKQALSVQDRNKENINHILITLGSFVDSLNHEEREFVAKVLRVIVVRATQKSPIPRTIGTHTN